MKPLYSALETALNRYLTLDPESEKRLHQLNGKIVTIELLGMNKTFQLIFANEKIHLQHDNFLIPDTNIKGTPLTLLHMSLTRGDRKHFFVGDVTIEGNLDLGQQVIDLFDHLEIDWEEYASRWIGDVPSHQFGRIIRNVKNFTKRAQNVLLKNVNEYVHEETDLFPPHEALQDFFLEVDELRMDVDRIAVRVEQIKRSML